MLKKISCNLAHKLWIFLCKSENRSFFKNLSDVKGQQEKVLFSLLEKNLNSEYGQKYNFKDITSIEDYQKFVPLTDYSDYEKDIEKIANGEKNILTSENVFMFELSSGSTSASKYIPYTSTLKEEFQRTIKTWIYDFYSKSRELHNGKSLKFPDL